MLSFTSCTDDGYFFSADAEEIVVHLNAPHTATVHGGVPPYRWEITGNAFKVRSWRTTLGDNKISVTTHYVAGESVEELTVTDRCGSEVSIMIVGCIRESCCDASNYTPPTFTLDDYEDGDTSVTCRIANGCPPFHWTTYDPTVGLANRFTDLRSNTLYKAAGIYYDPAIYVTDNCGNGTGNLAEYSFYFPFAGSLSDSAPYSAFDSYEGTPIAKSAYAEFPQVYTGLSYLPCSIVLEDSDVYTPIAGSIHLHIEFYVSSTSFVTCVYHPYYHYSATGTTRLRIVYDVTGDYSYIDFSATGQYPAISMITPSSAGTYLWHFNAWHTVDVTRETPPNSMTRLYFDGVEVDSYYNGAWANVVGKLKIGAPASRGSSTLRLRNCWLIKGKILI